jgi:opacity protein-like surface antigen
MADKLIQNFIEEDDMQKRIIKSVALTAVLLAATQAYAVAPGFYIGAMAGPATNNGSDVKVQVQGSPTTAIATPKSSQFASRFLLGYQATNYVGIEGGLTFISQIKYDTGNATACGGTDASVRDIDVLAKGIVPFNDLFDVYAKAGPALVYQNTSNAMNPKLSQSCGKSQFVTKVRPTISLGASYTMSQNVVLDASYNLIMAGNPVNNISYFGLGITYHIVDVYCGQFLCN